MSEHPVVAVVDDGESGLVVWWVSVGVGEAGALNRLCGAWVVPPAEVSQTAPQLLAGRRVLATPAGLAVLDAHELAPERLVDAGATLAAVARERDTLAAVFEEEMRARRVAKQPPLVAPSWPGLRDVTEYRPLVVDVVRDVDVALTHARWVADLADAWQDVETERVARPFLRSLGGPLARPLPMSELEAGAPAGA